MHATASFTVVVCSTKHPAYNVEPKTFLKDETISDDDDKTCKRDSSHFFYEPKISLMIFKWFNCLTVIFFEHLSSFPLLFFVFFKYFATVLSYQQHSSVLAVTRYYFYEQWEKIINKKKIKAMVWRPMVVNEKQSRDICLTRIRDGHSRNQEIEDGDVFLVARQPT